MEMHPLEGMTIGITAGRRADEQAELLTRRGARVLHGPTIRTLPLGSEEDVRATTEALVRVPPDVVVANTGVGVRGWLALAESWGIADSLVAGLAAAYIVSRGPKATGALITAGLTPQWLAPGERLAEVVAHLIDRGVAGRRVAFQLDGNPESVAAERLRSEGADVVDVPVYRWTLPDDITPAVRLVDAACSGRLDAMTFTSAPAVRNLFAVAEGEGMGAQLRDALNSSVLAMCVGPVCQEEAVRQGVVAEQPERARLGAMVQSLTNRLESRRRVIVVGSREVILQGSLVITGVDRIELKGRERAVFEILARRPGVVVPKRSLLAEVWGSVQRDPRVLEVTVGRLRRRLESTGLGVEAIVRRGYRLAVAS